MNIYNGPTYRHGALSSASGSGGHNARRGMNLQPPAQTARTTEAVYRSIQSSSMPQSTGPYRSFTGIPASRDQVSFVQQQNGKPSMVQLPQQKIRMVTSPKNSGNGTATYFVPYLPVDLQDYGLDECSYAFSNVTAGQLIPEILRSFASAKVDHDGVRSDSCTCNCSAVLESGSKVNFSMEIFRLTPAEQEENGRLGEYLIVLQRFCSVFPAEWKKFMSSIFWQLVNRKIVSTNFTLLPPNAPLVPGADPLSAGSLCRPPALDRTPSAVAEQERNLKHLLELAQSPFADVKEQASGILMSLSRNVDAAILLARLEAVKCLCDGISAGDNDSDWTRAAIATIANVCEKHQFLGESENQLVGVLDVVVQLFLALKDSTSYLKQELKRETTRALAELTAVQSVKAHIAQCGGTSDLANAVQSCMHSGDARLASLASRTLGNLV